MYLTVIHPFGVYQPGDVIAPADEAAILASEAAKNVVASGSPSPELARAVEPEPVVEPEPEPVAPAFAFSASPPFVAVSDDDPS